MQTIHYLNEFYSHYDEDGRLSKKHGSVEFLTTMRYIGKYINMHWLVKDMRWMR